MRWPWLLIVLAACSSGGGAVSATPPPLDAPAIVLDAGPDLLDDAAAAPGDAGVAADPAAKLKEGRALSAKQQWAASIAALELASSGGEVQALAELAFTAVLAGDDRRATRAAQAVLELPGVDASIRATALYHLGRAAELRGDAEAARAAYQQSLALRASTAVSDRIAGLGKARALPTPPAPPCNRPQPAAALCTCLGAALALDGARCVTSHRHGGGAYAVSVVAREQAPTFLVSIPAKGQVRVLARLGVPSTSVPDAELTITRWNVLHGPAGVSVIRVDAAMAQRDPGGKSRVVREDAIVCLTGASPRCVAIVPVTEKVGTPSAVRHLEVALDVGEAAGVAHVTVLDGPSSPSTLLGSHQLW